MAATSTLFFSTDELSGYTSQWSTRGLSSHSLKSVPEGGMEPSSYHYSGQPARQVGSPSSYSHSYEPPESQVDPYEDPYNPHSGYAKQKGYPPKTNHPSSSRYNPYKEMGYYGYTYGGPPTGAYSYETVNDQSDPEGGSEPSATDVTPHCEVTAWGDWSQCSQHCGTGTRTRTRHYTQPESSSCSAELLETQQCEETSGCRPPAEDTTVPPRARRLTTTTTQSSLTEPTQTPRLLRRPTGRPGRRLPGAQRLVGTRRNFSRRDPQCQVATWTDWSPCSVTCNQGYKIRTRVYKMPFVPGRTCENVRLTQKQDCRMAVCWNSQLYDGHDDPGLQPPLVEIREELPLTLTIVEQPKQPFCQFDPAPGYCKSSQQQWFYNSTEGSCARFMYTGCGGNRNNFKSESLCQEACSPEHQSTRDPWRGLQSQSLVREEFLQDMAPVASDCLVSDWSPWSPCSASCARGWMERDRQILQQPTNGGRPCPRKLTKRKRCENPVPCPANPPNWYQSNWRMLEEPGTDYDYED